MSDLSDLIYLPNSPQTIIGLIVIIIFAIVVLIAWFVAMKLFIKAAKMKGHYLYGGTAPLWFVAIFATPILVGIYVAGLPDLSNEQVEYPAQDQYFDGYYQQSYDPYFDQGYQNPYASRSSSPYTYPVQYPPTRYDRRRW